jgi:16S rRNA (cytosine1402-N4)-methyltransferase
MLDEVVSRLAPAAGEIFIDGTFGGGGYTRALLDRGARVIGIDRDQSAIAGGAGLVSAADGRLTLVEGRFSELDTIASKFGITAADGVVLDIGVSSMQLDQAERGFSFMRDGPLDMRMGKHGLSAADVVNAMEPRDLARVISVLGEEKKAGQIARAIGARRDQQAFSRTGELAALIEKTVGRRHNDPIHPATRTFQALRIYVNEELFELATALGAAERILKAGGRLVIVAFHSLEDRIVKRFLAERSRLRPTGSRHAPAEDVAPATFSLIERGAIAPGEAELSANPRARSAKLRAALRTAAAPRPVDPFDLGVPRLPSLQPSRA